MSMAQKIERKDLLNAEVNQKVSVVEIKNVTIPPSGITPKHLHPCPVVGIISSGKVLFQIEGESQKIINQGEAFFEPKNKVILHFDNMSSTEPLIFSAYYLKSKNEKIIKILD